jgi:hypothetical protein
VLTSAAAGMRCHSCRIRTRRFTTSPALNASAALAMICIAVHSSLAMLGLWLM